MIQHTSKKKHDKKKRSNEQSIYFPLNDKSKEGKIVLCRVPAFFLKCAAISPVANPDLEVL